MPGHDANDDVQFAWQHALFWLCAGTAAGLWLSLLLLFPQLNVSELTYGRIVPVHLNFQLYGWSSLPLIAGLLKIFPARSQADVQRGRSAVLAWSMALGAGGIEWLAGQNSGKIFLEWEGFPRAALPLAMLYLWVVLAGRYRQDRRRLKGLVLASLLPVPWVWYWASSPYIYPAVNPDTSGPTGASLLGSTLVVVLLLLAVAPVLGKPLRARRLPWIIFVLQILAFALADKSNSSHRSLAQILILGLLLLWIPLLPYYFRAFEFPARARPWLTIALAWFALLVLTGWISFLPRILDGMKFTNGLVAHSHLAMTGFVTAFNFFLASTILPWTASRTAFWHWNGATLIFVLLLWIAGFLESRDAAFTIVPNGMRTLLYAGRTLAGVVLAICAWRWWIPRRAT